MATTIAQAVREACVSPRTIRSSERAGNLDGERLAVGSQAA